MVKGNGRSTSQKVVGGLLIAAGIGVGGWILLIVSDLLTAWWVFNRMSTVLASRGVDTNMANLIGLGYAFVTAAAAHGVVSLLLRRNTTAWLGKVVLIMGMWYGSLYIVEYPYHGTIYNVFTGEAKARYYTTGDGRIEMVPLGVKVGPEGQTVHDLDPATAEKYRKQEELTKPKSAEPVKSSSLFDFFRPAPAGPPKPPPPEQIRTSGSVRDSNQETWAERLQVAPDRTILYLASQGLGGKPGILYKPNDAAYLVDEKGRVYPQIEDSTAYVDTVHESGFFGLGAADYIVHRMRAEEIYHRSLTFAPFFEKVSTLRLHYAQLNEPVEITSFIPWAEQIAQLSPPSVRDGCGFSKDESRATQDRYPSSLSLQESSTRLPGDVTPKRAKYLPGKFPDDFVVPETVTSEEVREIEIRATISADGKIVAPQVVRSHNDREFNQAALIAMKEWEYIPAQRNGAPIAANLSVVCKYWLTPAIPPANQTVSSVQESGTSESTESSTGAVDVQETVTDKPIFSSAQENRRMSDSLMRSVSPKIDLARNALVFERDPPDHFVAPEKTMHVEPEYPPVAKRLKVGGVVEIEATITAQGTIEGAKVVRSSNNSFLDESALVGVRQWRYRPAQVNHEPVGVKMKTTVVYSFK